MKNIIITPKESGASVRRTPTWEKARTVILHSKALFLKAITGRLPIGIMPFPLISEVGRKKVVSGIKQLQTRQYEDTDDTEPVFTKGGIPFVNAKTLDEYLATEPDPDFERIVQPLLDRLIQWFISLGFIVEPLIDPITMMQYHSKVCRHIAVHEDCFKPNGNQCTVLHCDDILRDGIMKPDFRIPIGLDQKEYFQFSVCTLLEDGGYRPDNLIVYEQQYSPEMEPEFDAWRAPQARIQGRRFLSHTPQLGETYLFSTFNLHDVRGGHSKSERLTFSVFFIYVPETNTIFYYN